LVYFSHKLQNQNPKVKAQGTILFENTHETALFIQEV